jgi:hypothetical protein
MFLILLLLAGVFLFATSCAEKKKYAPPGFLDITAVDVHGIVADRATSVPVRVEFPGQTLSGTTPYEFTKMVDMMSTTRVEIRAEDDAEPENTAMAALEKQ